MNYSNAEKVLIKRHYKALVEGMGWQLLISSSYLSISYKAEDKWKRWQTEDGFVVPPIPRTKKFKVQKRYYQNFIIDNYLIPFEKAKKTLAEDYIQEDVKFFYNDYKQDKFIEHHNKIHDEMREAQKVQ